MVGEDNAVMLMVGRTSVGGPRSNVSRTFRILFRLSVFNLGYFYYRCFFAKLKRLLGNAFRYNWW